LRPAIAEARPALDQANGLARAAPAQLRPVAPLLDRIIPIAEQLDPALDLLNPALDQLRVRTPELLSFLTLGTDTGANYDAVGHALRVAALSTEIPQRRLGDADTGPGCHTRPFDRLPGVLENQPWEDYADSFVGGGEEFESFDFERTPQGDDC
nr:hypothetical protein [Thermoleophilaceae bacterium]